MNSNGGTLSQTVKPIDDNDKYALELIPAGIKNMVMIKFAIAQDSYVIIKVEDIRGNMIQELVCNEMQQGSYKVFNKTPEAVINDIYKYKMEIFNSNGDLKDLVYSKEIISKQKK